MNENIKAEGNLRIDKYAIQSEVDQLSISVLEIAPDFTPIGIIQMVHGMCEYKDRYIDFMKFLAGKGFVCVMHDHRGHGESIKSNDDLGYFGQSGYTALISDLHQLMLFVKNKYSGLPILLFGHSMGSMIVRTFAKKFDYEIDGLIVCGSPSYNWGAKFGILISKIQEKCIGDHFRSKLVQKLTFLNNNKLIKNPQSPNAWLCSNPEFVAWYDNNPRCNFIFTANGFKNLFALMVETYRLEDWQIHNNSMPILFVAGEEDPCIINQRKFKQAGDCMKQVGYIHIEQKLYKKMRHEITNEIDKETVWNDIFQFCLKTTQKTAFL